MLAHNYEHNRVENVKKSQKSEEKAQSIDIIDHQSHSIEVAHTTSDK